MLTIYNSRKKAAQHAESEGERLTFRLLHQTKGQQSSFPPGRSSPVPKETRPWCTSCLGWRSRGSSPTSRSLESPIPASCAGGNSTGALSNKSRPRVLSFREWNLQLLTLCYFLSFHKNSWKRFPTKGLLGHLSPSRNRGGIVGTPTKCLAWRLGKMTVFRKERSYGRAVAHVATGKAIRGISPRGKAPTWSPRAMQWKGGVSWVGTAVIDRCSGCFKGSPSSGRNPVGHCNKTPTAAGWGHMGFPYAISPLLKVWRSPQ